jgi:hypothetical protein
MQNISQQYPEDRMRLLKVRGVPKEYSGELLISCLDLSRVGYLHPDMPFSPADNRSQNYLGDVSRSRVSGSPMPAWPDVSYQMY